MAIFLCGFMGCGKTTIGKNLAKLLGRGYCDMDELIVKKAGMSIPEIFETKGEKHNLSGERNECLWLSEIREGCTSSCAYFPV